MEDLRSKISDRIKQIQGQGDARYAKLMLKFNPFPAAAIAQHTHFEPVDEKTRSVISNFIEQTFRKNDGSGNYSGLTVLGEYGFGKTHLLKYVKTLIDSLTDDPEIKIDTLTVFIDRPEQEPGTIIHKIVENLQPDNLRRLIWYCIYPNIISGNKDRFLTDFWSLTLFSKVDPRFDKLYEIPILSNPLVFYNEFKALGGDVKKLVESSRDEILKRIVQDPALADRYLGLIFPEKRTEYSWDVLAGNLASKNMQNKEVIFLNSIVKILQDNGFNMVYVFIDEFEDIRKLKGAKLTNYISTLNTMINRERKWSVIVALTAEALEIIKQESPPLYDRLTTYQVQLDKLNKSTAKSLVSNYSTYAQLGEIPFQLFSDELIEEILRDTDGNFRHFIRQANKIVEKAADLDLAAPIKSEIINKLD